MHLGQTDDLRYDNGVFFTQYQLFLVRAMSVLILNNGETTPQCYFSY